MKGIMKHYQAQAERFGETKQMSMLDENTKDLEVAKIIECVENLGYGDILDVGCGNGYTLSKLDNSGHELKGVDTCEELIKIAKERNLKDTEFGYGNVCDLPCYNDYFDIVISERCLINLSKNKQKQALDEIWRVLKPDGAYIMIEAFTDGLANLNQARKDVGLKPIPEPKHNCYFDKGKLFKWMEGKFRQKAKRHNFLSSYYFGSRVLYPALVKKVEYNTEFVKFFRDLSPIGNYSYIQLYIWRKI